MRAERAAPGIAISYEGGDPRYLEHVLPHVDAVELTPDGLARPRGDSVAIPRETLDALEALGGSVRMVAHGVGLSIGSADGWSDEYLRILDQLAERLPLAWHSEHLGYVNVDGAHLGTMLPLPRTEEALDLVSGRIELLQARYGIPFLVENIVRLLPEPDGEMSDAAFLNELAGRTGCGLLLDVYNLECDAQNVGLDVPAFLAELDVRHVHELHVACGVEHAGMLLDVHSRPLRDSTIALARDVIDRPGARVALVTYELLAEAIPVLGAERIGAELQRLRRALAA